MQKVDRSGIVGLYTSLGIDTAGRPHIAYYDQSRADLNYTFWNGSAWVISTVDSAGNVGRFVSLALDGNNIPHISYYDVSNTDLKYAVKISTR
jgi:hypothetical protein